MLYPLKFKPIFKDKIWGGQKIRTILGKDFSPLPNCGESWEISGVQGNISKVSNGFLKGNTMQELVEIYMGDLVGDKIYAQFGIEFPLLIKFIDANDILSVQVHPDDDLAVQRHNAYGKTEMWYVIQSDKDSKIYTGFNRKITKQEYLEHYNNKMLTDLLNIEETAAGDVFFLPAGRIHSIGSGLLLAEIQQTSDITYRIYDWDRLDSKGKSRQLHSELALDAIDYNYYNNYKTKYELILNKTINLSDCKYFTTNIIELDNPVEKDYTIVDSFVIYICIEGSLTIDYSKGKESLIKGETALIPAELKNILLVPETKAKIIEVYIKSTPR
ncbi:MAG: class I mannose-6-phosphate isomerase [Bacteroidia bacterium]|nr:class I mannose-6-phosphate isomerase [Bacteroidia bacterium]